MATRNRKFVATLADYGKRKKEKYNYLLPIVAQPPMLIELGPSVSGLRLAPILGEAPGGPGITSGLPDTI